MATEKTLTLDPQPVTLSGNLVRLEPLGLQHTEDIYEVGKDDPIWRFLPRPAFADLADAQAWIEQMVDQTNRGESVAFAVIHLETGKAIGSTSYLDIDRSHRALEIGMTWYAMDWQRTGVNTECKYLLMTHAFEDHAARRVSLKTDSRNERSQRAILRIGAMEEGTWRNHRIAWDGVDRHSVYFSVIDSEWPDVKHRLQGLMQR